MLDATEARKLSGSYQSEKAAIDEIATRIQDAALLGKYLIVVGTMTDFARQYLKQRGYEVIANEHPDGGSRYTISWDSQSQYR